MTLLSFIDDGLMAGCSAILGGLICLLTSRRHRADLERIRAELQFELRSMMQEHEKKCAGQIEQAARVPSRPDITVEQHDPVVPGARPLGEIAHGRLTRSVRSQAIQLLRAGMPPQRAATVLGIGRREMLLIASVLRTLAPQ